MADFEPGQLALYCGHLTSIEDIPKEQSNQIKIFVSCNPPGEDFKEERQAILCQVIPQLREETKAKYGLELHYVDLMVGEGGGDSTGSYKAREFRLKELIRAQRLSAGSSFLAFVGQKYGERPVPQLILSEIYELLETVLAGNTGRRSRHKKLLEKWYKPDENSIPMVHVLRSPEEHGSEEWAHDKPLLQAVLMYSVEMSCKNGSLPQESMRTYFASELENEIKHGLMNADRSSSLVFHRTITDLSNYAKEERAKAFAETEWNDIEERWQLCPTSKHLLDGLMTDVIAPNLDSECISQYSILWRYDSGVHAELHKDYIKQLCEDALTKLRVQISDAAAVLMSRKVPTSRLHNEVLTHWRRVVDRGDNCLGREAELNCLTQYLQDTSNNEFFTIYGESGSGKTCILSKLMLEMPSSVESATITIARFIGQTQDSTNLRDLLSSICQQLLACLSRDTAVPTDFADILQFFHSLLLDIPNEINLVLVLDSLGSLLPEYNAHLLQWLPTKLASNVKIIVSCQPLSYGMFTRIKTEIIAHNHSNFIEVTELGESKAMLLTLNWLQHESMSITNSQAELLVNAFKKCSQPLYVKMVFERVKLWKSFDIIEEDTLGSNCETFLDLFFGELDDKYGQTLMRHAISYLTASKTGLSDMEVEDLLSLDECVMSIIHTENTPTVRRCPPALWARMRDDLEPLLKMSVADDYDVYYWDHSIITTFTENRYLQDDTFRKQIHHVIADYYLGNWYNKPMKYQLASGKEALANRNVLSQPLTYINALGETHYNKRKYDQVPRHLYLANRLDELNATVLFSYDWLYNKIKALSLQSILADLSLNPSVDATLLEGALRSAQLILEENINSMPAELSGRLLPYYNANPKIKMLIDQCDSNGLAHCALVPSFNYHQVPGSPLQYTFDCVDTVDSLLVTHDGKHVLTKSNESQTMRKFDLQTGAAEDEVLTSYGKAYVSPNNQYLILVDNEIEKSIKVHDAVSGNFLFQLIPINVLEPQENKKYNLGSIAISERYIAVLITTETTHLCIASFDGQDFITVINLGRKGTILNISLNEKFIVCNSGYNVLVYSLDTFELVGSTQLEYKPTHLSIDAASGKAFISDESSHIVTIIHLSVDGYTQMISKIPLLRQLAGDRVMAITLSHNDHLLLTRGEDNIVVYDTTTDKVAVHVERPESVMREFRLPRHSTTTKIVFTDAIFSQDDSIMMTSLFRNIQFWDVQTGNPLATTILAPVGIITKIFQTPYQGQIITIQQESETLQVWNLQNSIKDITSLDRLTTSIETITITQDNQTCFVTAKDSDEVGVIDMNTGLLINLLTHESKIIEITPVGDGSFLFVTLEPSKTHYCHKIWSVGDREIIKEFGQSLGFTTCLRKKNTIIHISQISEAYKAPFVITIYKFEDGVCIESTYDFTINYAMSKPFVTADDTYMVLLTADQYIGKEARYGHPSICAFYLKGRYMHSIIGRNELRPFLDTRDIVDLAPIPQNNTEVIAIYKPDTSNHTTTPYGFVMVDLATGTILRYSDNFMPARTHLPSVYLTNDGSLCINATSGAVFEMRTGNHISSIRNQGSKLALLSNGNVAAYYLGSELVVERVKGNQILGRCDVHVDICHIVASKDDRTLMVGCVDGTVLRYMLVDPDIKDVPITGRQSLVPIDDDNERPTTASKWDQTDPQRPTSRLGTSSSIRTVSLTSDRDTLRHIRPLYRSLTAAQTTRGGSKVINKITSTSYDRSSTCSIM